MGTHTESTEVSLEDGTEFSEFSLIMPIDAIKMIFMTAGIVVPLPFMFMRHKSLVKKYKNV